MAIAVGADHHLDRLEIDTARVSKKNIHKCLLRLTGVATNSMAKVKTVRPTKHSLGAHLQADVNKWAREGERERDKSY